MQTKHSANKIADVFLKKTRTSHSRQSPHTSIPSAGGEDHEATRQRTTRGQSEQEPGATGVRQTHHAIAARHPPDRNPNGSRMPYRLTQNNEIVMRNCRTSGHDVRLRHPSVGRETIRRDH